MGRTQGTITARTITARTITTDLVSEFLHLAALAPAGVAACCVASGRGRRRGRTVEIAVAVLMLAAMVDVSRSTTLLAPVLWAGLLLLGGLTLAATTGRRSGNVRQTPRGSALAHGSLHGAIHGALGCIVMAALVMVMVAPARGVGGGAGAAVSSHHGVGASASVLTVLIVVGVLAYAVYSVVALRRGPLRERIQFAAMGASTLGMAAAVML